ncbi:hypothetical protein [Microvirga roseola]|uniref:hypothetical protein n=1 Tax=Microvirga roseola TaxID=2883126 RepID=UPI001E45FCA2|nr:hypothetical protein [Microvirga roseola]
MTLWATIVALAAGALVHFEASPSFLIEIAELVGVIALFTLVCAAEAFSEPRAKR